MGKGIVTVSNALFEGVDAQKQPQTLAAWKVLLMLPEEFNLLEAKLDPVYPYWNIMVEYEAIPATKGKLPDVTLIYTRQHNEEDGTDTTYLERVEAHVSAGESPMKAIKKQKDPSYISSLIEKRNPVIWQRNKE